MFSSPSESTLVRVWFPKFDGRKIFFAILFANIFLAVSAQISITLPYTPVDLTGQSFAVLLVGMILGARWGVVAVLGYIFLGAMGLPIFSQGASGWGALTGSTGGYFGGFVLGVFFVGVLAEHKDGQAWRQCLISVLGGTALILGGGVLRLAHLYGWNSALEYGFYPPLPGACVKAILLVLTIQGLWKVSRIRLLGDKERNPNDRKEKILQ